MLNKANLAMTDADHESVGSTVPHELRGNPGKTLAETMNDEELAAFVRNEVEAVREVHSGIMAGAKGLEPMLKTGRDGFLLPNIRYLREIGRLPDEYKEVDFEKEFAL